jgi:hypothetical protein
MRRTNSSTERSLIARRRLGVPPGNVSSRLVVSPSRAALEPRVLSYSQESFLTIGRMLRSPLHHVKRVGSRIRVESEEVGGGGWDASARLLGIVRYRDAGDVDGALGALVRGGIRLAEVSPGIVPGAITERAAAAMAATSDRP